VKPEKIKPPVYVLFCLLVIVLLVLLFPEMKILGLPFLLTGIIFILLGVGLNLWAWAYFNRAGTPENYEKPTFLVKEGPYQFSRNPMHLGGILLVAGISLITGNVLTLVAPVILCVILRVIFIPFEEKMMEDIFAREFLDYKESVRRWL